MEIELISTKIFEYKGVRVILDADIAQLYGVETRMLNQAVKRNLEKFPQDFMFVIDYQTLANLISQNVISSRGGNRKSSLAFIEHGVAMLSSVLKSKKAVQMNIAIIRAFIKLRDSLFKVNSLSEQIQEVIRKLKNHDEQLESIYLTIENMLDKNQEIKSWEDRERIGFK